MSPPSALFIHAVGEATAEVARQPVLDCTTPDYSYCHPAMATLRAFDDATILCVYRDRLRDEDGRRYAADPPARPARVLVGRELLPWESAGRAFYLLLYALYCAENPAAWGEIQRHMSFVDETGLYAVTDPLDPWPITGAAALALLARGEPLAPSMAPLFERASGLRALPRLETVAAARTMGETAARAVATHGEPAAAVIGTDEPGRQCAILGQVDGVGTVALDLSGAQTIGVFGVQGSGKSTTIKGIIEAAVQPQPGLNRLDHPLCAVACCYTQDQARVPEFAAMREPAEGAIADVLGARYGARPAGIRDMLILVPPARLADRRREYGAIPVAPLLFRPRDLDVRAWRHLMGMADPDSVYGRTMDGVMASLGDAITLDGIAEGIEASRLGRNQKNLAHLRLEFAARFVGDGAPISTHIKPGRFVIVDLRDPMVHKTDALTLFMVLLPLIAAVPGLGKACVLDEAHEFDGRLMREVIHYVRDMRHQGLNIIVGSQDPASVPVEILELSTTLFLHCSTSPAWLRHLRKAVTALDGVRPRDLAVLRQGEALVTAKASTLPALVRAPFLLRVRPQASRSGGETVHADLAGHVVVGVE